MNLILLFFSCLTNNAVTLILPTVEIFCDQSKIPSINNLGWSLSQLAPSKNVYHMMMINLKGGNTTTDMTHVYLKHTLI